MTSSLYRTLPRHSAQCWSDTYEQTCCACARLNGFSCTLERHFVGWYTQEGIVKIRQEGIIPLYVGERVVEGDAAFGIPEAYDCWVSQESLDTLRQQGATCLPGAFHYWRLTTHEAGLWG